MCRRFLLCLLLSFLVVICNGYLPDLNEITRNISSSPNTSSASFDEPKVRTRRGVFWNFIQKVVTTKNLIIDQYVDTKDTLNTIYNLMNEVFSDPEPQKPTIRPATTETTKSTNDDEDSTATTTENYQISRYEFGRLLGRNFRGLNRLKDNEIEKALNQSKLNIEEYKLEAKKQFSNSWVTKDVKSGLKKG